MTSLPDIQETFNSKLFQVACQDCARITCLMAFESDDVRRPREMNSIFVNMYEKGVFLFRFCYLLIFTGFMPTIFDLIPFRTWQFITVLIYAYRLYLLPFYLRLVGYGKHADWKNPPLGSRQPSRVDSVDKHDGPVLEEVQVYFKSNDLNQLTEYHALSRIDFGDPCFEKFISLLYHKVAHLSPHSQSPGNPLNHSNFPGNFMNHLLGVYKILVAWGQPQYICRAGLFHSVYGTFDYRTSHFYDLRRGRKSLQDLIGVAAEEISFAICTSDRLLLMRDIREAMYGKEAAKNSLVANSIFGSPAPTNMTNEDGVPNGNPHPPVIGKLTESGFQVRNHITQEYHVLPPDLFASFIVVFCADFMDQGAAGTGTHDYDICLFQFQRYRFFRDILCFVEPYLRVKPPVMQKYMGLDKIPNDSAFAEPSREEVLLIKGSWDKCVRVFMTQESFSAVELSDRDKDSMLHCTLSYPWLMEPFVILACSLKVGEPYKGVTRGGLAKKAKQLLLQWGMCTYKTKNPVKFALNAIDKCLKM